MSYPFVQAFHDYGPRLGPIRAFVVHMAEGGGTVGYLSRENPRGVSVHYVIEYDGTIVQMLREDHASGSINPNDLRQTEGPDPYGATIRRRTMTTWDRNPNQATITLEIEGFAAAGPNTVQRLALKRLIDDVRSRYPGMGLLGHRDFTSRKACPGAFIPWDTLGGHGPAGQETGGDMAIKAGGSAQVQPWTGYEILLSAGRNFYNDPGLTDQRGEMSSDRKVPYAGRPIGVAGSRAVWVYTRQGYPDGTETPNWTLVYVVEDAGTPVPVEPTPPPPADCSVQDQKIADAIEVLSA